MPGLGASVVVVVTVPLPWLCESRVLSGLGASLVVVVIVKMPWLCESMVLLLKPWLCVSSPSLFVSRVEFEVVGLFVPLLVISRVVCFVVVLFVPLPLLVSVQAHGSQKIHDLAGSLPLARCSVLGWEP